MRVILIGAGPGDGGLITLKAAERLRTAEIVLYDRLVSAEVLAMIPDTAEKINVGKSMSNHLMPQDEINRLLLSKAKSGAEVVRLKGGDPFVFGRGGEELELLAENGIPFEVIPGVSSSIAGAAYAGIPVTHRDYTSSVHIITGHGKNNSAPVIDYESLVRLNGTLVFMMSVSTIGGICGGCINAGMDETMPAAIIENATTNRQRKFIGTVKTLADIAAESNVKSPSVIIIGKVCELSQSFDWFSVRPLHGTNIIVTRARDNASSLSSALRELGCNVVEMPCIRITPTVNRNNDLQTAVDKIGSYGWIAFTSAAGVNIFFDYLLNNDIDIRCLNGVRLAAVGTETKKAIRKRGLNVNYVPDEYNSGALADGLITAMQSGERLLIARAAGGTEELTSKLRDNDIILDEVALYKTENPETDRSEAIKMIEQGCMVTFTSSSTVDGFAKAVEGVDLNGITAVCIGERTKKRAEALGLKTVVSDSATIESMVQRIKEVLSGGEVSCGNKTEKAAW